MKNNEESGEKMQTENSAGVRNSIIHLNDGTPVVETKKQKIIQWDEETIAEHDKLRGTRQKIDEAPTPYRYDSDTQSEAESVGSNSSSDYHLRQSKRIAATNSLDDDHHSDSSRGSSRSHGNGSHHVHWSTSINKNFINDSWEEIQARLQYAKHLQDQQLSSDSNNLEPMEEENDGENQDDMNVSDTANTTSVDGTGRQKKLGMRYYSSEESLSNLQGNNDTTTNTASDNQDSSLVGHNVFTKLSNSVSAISSASSSAKSHGKFSQDVNEEDDDEGDDEEEDGDSGKPQTAEFKNKRTSHYNEFKVLQAMRAKLAAEEDEDEEDNTNDNYDYMPPVKSPPKSSSYNPPK